MTLTVASAGILGWGVGVALGALFVLLCVWGMQPVAERNLTPERLRTLLEALLFRGRDGATMQIRTERGQPLAVVEKRVAAIGNVRLTIRPAIVWESGARLDTVRAAVNDALRRAGQPSLSDTGLTSGVDVGSDVGLAGLVLSCVLESSGRVIIAQETVATIRELDPRDVRIGF